jgi:hypothetical protein
MGEFAQGYLSSAAGPIRNAYDPSRNASGSSGGTGAGVAANFAAIGIGEDTGDGDKLRRLRNGLRLERERLHFSGRKRAGAARAARRSLGRAATARSWREG